MLSLTIVPPKHLSSELNTEGVIDFGFHSGGANKREAFIHREFSYTVATRNNIINLINHDELQWQLTHVNTGNWNYAVIISLVNYFLNFKDI